MVEVDEQRATLDMLSNNKRCITIEHDGGHFVPMDAKNIQSVVNFIWDRTGLQSGSWNIDTTHTLRHSRAVDPHELRRCLQTLEDAVYHGLPSKSGKACSVEVLDDENTKATPAIHWQREITGTESRP
jgi:hypothetical protein